MKLTDMSSQAPREKDKRPFLESKKNRFSCDSCDYSQAVSLDAATS